MLLIIGLILSSEISPCLAKMIDLSRKRCTNTLSLFKDQQSREKNEVWLFSKGPATEGFAQWLTAADHTCETKLPALQFSEYIFHEFFK